MRFVAAAAVVALSLLASRPAAAQEYEPPFDALEATLQSRFDNDFDGVLDATEKRQQKAVAKCLELLEPPTEGALNDMKILGTMAKLLEKAYPEEMAFGNASDLWVDSFTAFQALYFEFLDDYAPFKGLVGQLAPSGPQRKAANLLKNVEKARGSVGPEAAVSFAARQFLKAWKLTLKGLPVAEAGTLLPAPAAIFTAGSAAVTTDQVGWTWHSVTRRLDVAFSGTDPGTGAAHVVSLQLQLSANGQDLSVTNGSYVRTPSGGGEEYYDILFGTASFTTLDIPGRVFQGSFDVTFLGLGEVTVAGTVGATWYLEVEKD